MTPDEILKSDFPDLTVGAQDANVDVVATVEIAVRTFHDGTLYAVVRNGDPNRDHGVHIGKSGKVRWEIIENRTGQKVWLAPAREPHGGTVGNKPVTSRNGTRLEQDVRVNTPASGHGELIYNLRYGQMKGGQWTYCEVLGKEPTVRPECEDHEEPVEQGGRIIKIPSPPPKLLVP